MPRKSKKNAPSKDESEDDYENEEVESDEEEEEEEEEEYEESEIEEEKEDVVDVEGETTGCGIDEAIENDDEYFENYEETEIPVEQGAEYITKENRISSNRLTKYEMVRILGERTKQLTMGAKPLVKNYQGLSYDKVAEEEFKRNMIPFKIKRPLPNGKYEIWTLDELYKDHLLSLIE